MSGAERFQLAKDIPDNIIAALLTTSDSTQLAEGVNMREARWYFLRPHRALILDVDVAPKLQGWRGIIHGGSTDKIMHSVAGLAGLLEARRMGKMVLGKRFEVSYLRPVPLLGAVSVEATIQKVEKNMIQCSVIMESPYEKRYAQGSLVVQMVDEIRRKSP